MSRAEILTPCRDSDTNLSPAQTSGMYVCTHARMYVRTYVHIFVYMKVCMHVRTYVGYIYPHSTR